MAILQNSSYLSFYHGEKENARTFLRKKKRKFFLQMGKMEKEAGILNCLMRIFLEFSEPEMPAADRNGISFEILKIHSRFCNLLTSSEKEI
jgi:hypothetical protein